MSQPVEENRFRTLPEPVRPEDLIETVDVWSLPTRDEDAEERERLLRQAGGV